MYVHDGQVDEALGNAKQVKHGNFDEHVDDIQDVDISASKNPLFEDVTESGGDNHSSSLSTTGKTPERTTEAKQDHLSIPITTAIDIDGFQKTSSRSIDDNDIHDNDDMQRHTSADNSKTDYKSDDRIDGVVNGDSKVLGETWGEREDVI